jgi:hypothetical protein
MGRSVANPPDEAAGKTGSTPSHRASPRYMGAKGLKVSGGDPCGIGLQMIRVPHGAWPRAASPSPARADSVRGPRSRIGPETIALPQSE